MAWSRLQLQQLLGEGASGLIHQATLRTEEGEHTVAVKLFKGAVTSDGLPACEMAACLHAGTHPHLISALGRVTEHPEQLQALVMPLIAPEFGNLAGPPSLESCTRDVYANTPRLSWPAALRIAQGMASATAHLHARGVLHGDLYAHNILHNTQGEALLGDFGAASFLMCAMQRTRKLCNTSKYALWAACCKSWHCTAAPPMKTSPSCRH